MGRGKSKTGKEAPYGTEFKTVLKSGNIKFIKYKGHGESTNPRITKTRGRVYVTVNKNDTLKSIIYFDNKNKRKKQIDLDHPHKGLELHVHHGYNHIEYETSKRGATRLTPQEKRMVERVQKLWYDYLNRQ